MEREARPTAHGRGVLLLAHVEAEADGRVGRVLLGVERGVHAAEEVALTRGQRDVRRVVRVDVADALGEHDVDVDASRDHQVEAVLVGDVARALGDQLGLERLEDDELLPVVGQLAVHQEVLAAQDLVVLEGAVVGEDVVVVVLVEGLGAVAASTRLGLGVVHLVAVGRGAGAVAVPAVDRGGVGGDAELLADGVVVLDQGGGDAGGPGDQEQNSQGLPLCGPDISQTHDELLHRGW